MNSAASLQPNSVSYQAEHDQSHTAQAIYNAVEHADWTALAGWDDFAAIADSVEPDSMVVYAESATDDGTVLTVPADLSVILNYVGAGAAEATTYTDSFPAILTLRRSALGVEVTGIAVTINREA